MNHKSNRELTAERTEKPQGRIVYLDLLRIAATIAVIWLHISATGWEIVPIGLPQWQIFNVFDSAVRVCVPAFVMISGVFFLDNSRELPISHLFKRNILRILTAFLFWSTAYAAGHVVFDAAAERRIGPWLVDRFFEYVLRGHYHLWFLFTIAGLYLITPFLRRISSDKKLVEYFLLLSFLFCFTGNLLKLIPAVGEHITFFFNASHLHFVLGYTGYFFLGYYLHRYGVSRKIRAAAYMMAVFGFLVTAGGTDFLVSISGRARQELYSELLPTTFFVSGGVFLLFQQCFANMSLKGKTAAAVQKISGLSFGIYLIHDLFRMLFTAGRMSAFLTSNPVLAVPALTGIVFLCSLLSAAAVKRLPVLRRYIL